VDFKWLLQRSPVYVHDRGQHADVMFHDAKANNGILDQMPLTRSVNLSDDKSKGGIPMRLHQVCAGSLSASTDNSQSVRQALARATSASPDSQSVVPAAVCLLVESESQHSPSACGGLDLSEASVVGSAEGSVAIANAVPEAGNAPARKRSLRQDTSDGLPIEVAKYPRSTARE
jgi:hypothetical protein